MDMYNYDIIQKEIYVCLHKFVKKLKIDNKLNNIDNINNYTNNFMKNEILDKRRFKFNSNIYLLIITFLDKYDILNFSYVDKYYYSLPKWKLISTEYYINSHIHNNEECRIGLITDFFNDYVNKLCNYNIGTFDDRDDPTYMNWYNLLIEKEEIIDRLEKENQLLNIIDDKKKTQNSILKLKTNKKQLLIEYEQYQELTNEKEHDFFMLTYFKNGLNKKWIKDILYVNKEYLKLINGCSCKLNIETHEGLHNYNGDIIYNIKEEEKEEKEEKEVGLLLDEYEVYTIMDEIIDEVIFLEDLPKLEDDSDDEHNEVYTIMDEIIDEVICLEDLPKLEDDSDDEHNEVYTIMDEIIDEVICLEDLPELEDDRDYLYNFEN
jgi:hypothetical protein